MWATIWDTTRLTTIQHGAYFLLLLDYWRNGPIPNDDTVLAQISKLSPDAWSIHGAVLKHFFSIGEDGLLHHKRADRELSKAHENREKASRKAAKAANSRWSAANDAPSNAPGNASSNARAMLELCPSPSPLVLKDISEANASSPRSSASGRAASAAAIYEQYPRKEGRRAALKAIEAALKRLVIGEAPQAAMMPAEAKALLLQKVGSYACSPAGRNSDRTKIPHPTTWFNGSRYLDDEACWQLVSGTVASSTSPGALRLKETPFDGEPL